METLDLSTFLASEGVAALVVGKLIFLARVAGLGIVELDDKATKREPVDHGVDSNAYVVIDHSYSPLPIGRYGI